MKNKNKILTISLLLILLLCVFVPIHNTVVAEYPEGQPYNYWYAPENSIGIQETKTINWQYFRTLLNNNCEWNLYYKRFSYSDWTLGNNYLSIYKDWNENGFWKITLGFNNPLPSVYQAEFRFKCNINVLDYIEKDGTEITFTISCSATETYSLMFNYSDLKQIPNLYFEKGIQNGQFGFKFGRYNIPMGYYEFDPNFGEETEGAVVSGIEDVIACGYFLYDDTDDATGDSITAFLDFAPLGDYEGDFKFALYHQSDDSLVTNGVTNEGYLDQSVNSTGWYTKTFPIPPILVDGTTYGICAWAFKDTGVGDDLRIDMDLAGGTSAFDPEVYNGYPATMTPVDQSRLYSIYCTYTVDSAEPYVNHRPYVSDEDPTNKTNCINQNNMSIYVNDSDGNNSWVRWFTSFDNTTWNYEQLNTSILNETVHFTNNNFSNNGSIYCWRVQVNDTYGDHVNYTFWYYSCIDWVNTCPTATNPDPTNRTVCINQSNMSLYVGDVDGNNSWVRWFTSFDNTTWNYEQLNTSVLNETVYYDNTNYTNNGSIYCWRVWINDTFCHVNYTYWYYSCGLGYVDTPPTVNNPVPTNNSIDRPITQDLSIDISDDNGTFYWNISIYINTSWHYADGSNTNGTKSLVIPDLNYSQLYNWFVCVKDMPSGNWYNYSYKFTTIATGGCDCDLFLLKTDAEDLYLSATVDIQREFYLTLLFVLWFYLLFMAHDKDAKYLYYLQFGVVIPLFLYLVSDAYINSQVYGYMLGFIVILVSIYFLFVGLSKTTE